LRKRAAPVTFYAASLDDMRGRSAREMLIFCTIDC